MWEWKQAPTQIESDLLPKVDIFDWHRGTLDEFGALKLSSRRLLMLLRWLPATSAYKRGGGYTEAETMLAETHNEIAWLRLSYLVVNGGEDFEPYEPLEFVDPRIVEARAELKEAELKEHESLTQDFYSDMGFT